MSIAIMMESVSNAISNGKRRQTLTFKAGDDVVVFSRLTDGKQGPSNKWERRSFEEVLGLFHDGEHLNRDIAGVEVTLSDMAKFAEGSIQVLGVKAVSALNKSETFYQTDISAMEVFAEMYEAVLNDDVDLSTVTKMRKTAPEQTINHNIGGNANMTQGKTITAMSLASIPRKEIGDRYVNRKLPGNLYDYEVFDFARKTHANTLIYGPTGPGKTTSVEAWCATRGLRLATISGNATLEPSHMFGKYVSDGEGGFAWIDGPVTDVIRNGGALILDELNFINMKVITPLYPLLDARRSITLLDHHGETIEAHPDLTIFATMNPGYVGTAPLNFAFRNRFDIQIEWDYDYDVEAKLVKGKNLLDMAKHLRTEAAKGMYETPISTNMLIEFEGLAKDLSYEFAVENFIAHFSDEEKASIRMIFQTYEQNLRSELGVEELDITLDTESV